MNMRFSMSIGILMLLTFSCKNESGSSSEISSFTKLEGEVFGTSYSILYNSSTDYQRDVDTLFSRINQSMSTYRLDSDISRINRNEVVSVDSNFQRVFSASLKIYIETKGAFDPTIGGVVNAWDFGPEGNLQDLDSLKIDSLMIGVGFDKIELNDSKVEKPAATYIDFNAIAKGYAVDAIAEFLEHKEVHDYLVEIGGEIRVKGINQQKNSPWKVGIEEPDYNGERSILRTVGLHNESMATSGVYRKFKVDDSGNRYSHIIDTQTGYPSKSNILSISVIAGSCMLADGYATAFKTMGIPKVEEFLKAHSELKVFIIYENEVGEFETMSLNDFPG